MRDFRAIIVKLKLYLSDDIKRKVLDKDVSKILKINQARFATLKKRNVTPYEDILLFCETEKFSSDEMFFD